MAMSAQDKYSLQVPDGLAFAEFKGYEDWQVIAVSQTGDLVVAILGNPEMIDGLSGRHSWQRQTGPRRRQDGEDPLEHEKERGGPRPDQCA